MITRKFDRRIACVAVAALVSLGGSAAQALTSPQTITLTFTETVPQSCSVVAGTGGGTTMTFPTYDPTVASPPYTSLTMLTVTCTNGSSGVTVTLGNGNNFSGTAGRRMQSLTPTGHYLSYKLFYDNSGTKTPWTGSATPAVNTDGTATDLTVFAFINPSQPLFAATYQDQVVATVTF